MHFCRTYDFILNRNVIYDNEIYRKSNDKIVYMMEIVSFVKETKKFKLLSCH